MAKDYVVKETYFLDEDDVLQINECSDLSEKDIFSSLSGKCTVIQNTTGESCTNEYFYDLLERANLSDYSGNVDKEITIIVEVWKSDNPEKYNDFDPKTKIIIYKG